jgi:hypothetical protein
MEDRQVFCVGAGDTIDRAQFADAIFGAQRSHPVYTGVAVS